MKYLKLKKEIQSEKHKKDLYNKIINFLSSMKLETNADIKRRNTLIDSLKLKGITITKEDIEKKKMELLL